MPLWGTDPSSATNIPKYLSDSEDVKYNKGDAYANEHGWVMKAGSAATGNSNTSACLLYTSPSPRDVEESRMPSSA